MTTQLQPSLEEQECYAEIDQDELLWQTKIDMLFQQIIAWLIPFEGIIECKLLAIPLNNFEAFLEGSKLPVLATKKQNVLRIIFPSGKHADLLPFGPYVMGNNYGEYFAKVSVRLGNRKLVIVMENECDTYWKCAEYRELHEPLELIPFNLQTLTSFLL